MEKINLLWKRTIIVSWLIIFMLALTTTVFAQETMVVGQVLKASDKTPLHQVNIYFKNTLDAVRSNNEGYFLIKTKAKHTTLVFSSVGYKRQEIKITPGQNVGIDVQLEEYNTLLQEVFIIPGSNPALDFMKRVRLMAKSNDISKKKGFKAQSTEQNLVLLSKLNQRSLSKSFFEQLLKGNISKSDSSLVLPLYMSENKYLISQFEKKETGRNIFSSPESGVEILQKLVGEMSTELNFYDNSVTVFGKNIISPLANAGYAYYNYFLADSIHSNGTKQYEIHFYSKNKKNLAFEGRLWVDSSSFALTKIEAELPSEANINFIHNLRISQDFVLEPSKQWVRKSEKLALSMDYEVLSDSIHPKPEVFVKRSTIYSYNKSTLSQSTNFAEGDYTKESVDEKLKDLNNTPLLRSAAWVADAFFTGYMQVDKIDIGKIQDLARLSDMEGLRLNLPFKTNEKLSKNISIGGSISYATKNSAIKYSGIAQFKIPGEKRRIVSLSYNNSFRRIDFNYNNFLLYEDPLASGDEDIAGTVFGLRSAQKMSERKEYCFSFSNDWTSDIESNIFIRSNELFAADFMPLTVGGVAAGNLIAQSATLNTRFSFGERTYDNHMQRIYISNYKPVIYSAVEVGQYKIGSQSGRYGKIFASLKHLVNLDFGQFNYIAQAGIIIGKVPYPLLETPVGCETGGYSITQFNMMNYREYAADKYVSVRSELTLNGVIMNHIPLIKDLNLREICSFNMAYGSLSDSHKSVLDFPADMYSFNKPYMEAGVGLTNILHLFTLESVWRLTDLNHPHVTPWALRGCLVLNF